MPPVPAHVPALRRYTSENSAAIVGAMAAAKEIMANFIFEDEECWSCLCVRRGRRRRVGKKKKKKKKKKGYV